jgi:serine/threonine protein phosphatase 1
LGNHEQAMLDFIAQPQTIASWLNFGGRETLASYGVQLNHVPHLHELSHIAAQLDLNLPDSHREFLHHCASQWRCGSYYFVHAGIRPGVALNRQSLEDQLWIRGEFLLSDENHGAVVVHGHNISAQVEILPNRIGIDTGAYTSGVLTALVLEGSTQRLLQTNEDS